jgi:hypothetical protein
VNLAPRGEICPLGECSPLCSPPGVTTLYCLEEWRDKQRISPLGDKIHPWGSNFAPRGGVKNGPLLFAFISTIHSQNRLNFDSCIQMLERAPIRFFAKNLFGQAMKIWKQKCIDLDSGLPDFSWHIIPKRGKLYQITTTLPNGHKIYQMTVKYIFQMATKYNSIFHPKALQN